MHLKITPILLLSCLIGFGVTGCGKSNTENTESNGIDSSVANPGSSLPAGESQVRPSHSGTSGNQADYSAYNGIITGNGVRARAGGATKDQVIDSFDWGDLIKIISKSEKRDVLPGSGGCDAHGYKWVQVMDTEGNESWVYGKYVQSILVQSAVGHKGKVQPTGNLITHNGKTYTLEAAYSWMVDDSDEAHIHDCNDIYVPFFQLKGEKTIYPIRLKGSKLENDNSFVHNSSQIGGEYMALLDNSTGGSDAITKMANETVEGQELIRLDLRHFYQEGDATASLYVKRGAGKYFEVVDYRLTSMGK